MLNSRQTAIPVLVRVKPGALDRLGVYAVRHNFLRVLVFFSEGQEQDAPASNSLSLSNRAPKQ